MFIADVHLHSRYSRATSKNLDLENLNYWAQLKGVTVVGTADFTHPEWFAALEEQLEEAEAGLFKLRDEYSRPLEETLPSTCRGDVRFMLTVEISSIYKKNDKTRKVHNVVFMPSLAAAASFSAELAKIGNIKSDGRPILGLDCRDLLEIVLETHPDAFLVPAHIWTPHFAVLGAASGFETLEECYEELTPHIFAVETGLSSDPPMNWLLSQLDRYTLISNSDAHSPPKLMREANMFEAELSYYGIRKAWETGDPDIWKGTIEFFPEEGKYHLDGHRKCEERMTPEETAASDGRCPTCGKKVTVGVFNRVHTLADRPVGSQRENGSPFKHLVPLPEVIGQVFQVGDKSKRVQAEYFRLLHQFGNEFSILTEAPLDELAAFSSPLLARGIERIRTGRVDPISGYDGVYGVIRTITEEDREEADRQMALFDVGKKPEKKKSKRKVPARPKVKEPAAGDAPTRVYTEPSEHESHPLLTDLNVQQREAVTAESGPSLILAGAGTGKTTTLVRRLAWCVQEQDVNP
ncbi:MAG: UvrD-helicase domain-containing protein, partial [Planctomycetota bacterium]|nr:UvrD-helicase domain-containing protein [Planctomycetota bacterium]